MARSQAPVTRPAAWGATALGVGVLGLVVVAAWAVNGHDWLYALSHGALIYLAYSFGSRALVARSHRAGMRLVKAGRYQDAIPLFRESLAFFDRHPWLDRWRALLLLSGGAYSYRDMAQINQAFCYSQIGDAERAVELYHRVLSEDPTNPLALTALRSVETFRRLDPDSPAFFE